MSLQNISGVRGGSVREAMTAGTMFNNTGNVTINNIIIVQKTNEDTDEFIARPKDVLSTLPGDSRFLAMRQKTTVLLIGKSGAGKSALGNILLDKRVFTSQLSVRSVTDKVQSETTGTLTVIDTPGMFNTRFSNIEILQQIEKATKLLATGVPVIVLVTRIGRFTEEETMVVNHYMRVLGEEAAGHMMVVFTGKDELDCQEMTLKEYIRLAPQQLRQLIKDCENRCTVVNDRCRAEERTETRSRLLTQIEDIVKLTDGARLKVPGFMSMEVE